MTDQRPLALITGASSGIGLELARHFGRRGYDLVVTADDQQISHAAQELAETGADVQSTQLDLRHPDSVDELYSVIAATDRPLHAAALNAGVGQSGAFLDTDLRDDLGIIDLNVRSTVHLAKLVLRDMAATGHGKVLVTSSVAAHMPGPYQPIYNASKAFLQSFCEAVATEMEDLAQASITVTALLPGPTDTEFFERADLTDTRLGQMNKDDPALVAEQAFDALMSGKRNAFAGSLTSRAMGAAARATPDRAASQFHRKLAEPGSGTSD